MATLRERRIVRSVILRVARSRIKDGHDVDVLDVVRQLTVQFGAIPGLRSARFGRAVQAEGWSLIAVTEWDSLAAIQAVYGDGWAESTLLPGVEAVHPRDDGRALRGHARGRDRDRGDPRARGHRLTRDA